MRLPQILATIAAALLAVGTLNAQTTTMQVNAPYSCGVYSTPTRCYGLPVTVTAGTQVTGPTGTITLSYYASGYKAGSAVGYGVPHRARLRLCDIQQQLSRAGRHEQSALPIQRRDYRCRR
jgi:hypothetical protein